MNSSYFPCFSKFSTTNIVLFRLLYLQETNTHSVSFRKTGFVKKISERLYGKSNRKQWGPQLNWAPQSLEIEGDQWVNCVLGTSWREYELLKHAMPNTLLNSSPCTFFHSQSPLRRIFLHFHLKLQICFILSIRLCLRYKKVRKTGTEFYFCSGTEFYF